MNKIVLLLVMAVGMAPPVFAAKRVSVEQFEHLLAAAKGQSDGRVAGRLSGLELTERASSIRLARWEADFPGRRSREVLARLADVSAFLDLPAADIPANPPPDTEAQMAILDKAVDYVGKTISKLPNFYATRTTQHFEDNPPRETVVQPGTTAAGRGMSSGGAATMADVQSGSMLLHSTGTSSLTVSYRDGHELANAQRAEIGMRGRSAEGLTTAGEFGPILAIILGDAKRSSLTWGHWEQVANGQGADSFAAVFRYSVPQGQSSYLVAMPRQDKLIDPVFPAYQGEIAIDPANGDILRITVVADLAPRYRRVIAEILVEYGAVQIGGKTYFCPVKGVAISKMPPTTATGEPDLVSPVQTQMNDVIFSDYHLFRAEARMVPVDGGNSDAAPAGTK